MGVIFEEENGMKRKRAAYLIILTCGMIFTCACGNKSSVEEQRVEELEADTAISENLPETNAKTETDTNEDTTALDSEGELQEIIPDESEPEAIEDAVMEEAPEISLIMVGDVLLHTPVEESAELEDGSYDFSAIFANTIDEIATADLALVNQEVIIGGADLGVSGYPGFNAPFEIGDELVETGFDVVCHATNHVLDKKKKGLLNCIHFWKENYPQIAVLGISETEEESQDIYIYEQDGIKIAILNYTYGTNDIDLPKDMPFSVKLLDKETVESDLKRAEELADFTIVCPHWGTEYQLEPDDDQIKWAKRFLKGGADLVIGTHPHVIEPVEWLEDEESGNKMLVYYSLGNYVNWTSGKKTGTAKRMIGGMAEVTIGYLEDGSVGILDYGVKALVSHLEKGFGGVTTYNLSDYTEELADKNAIRKQDDSFTYEYAIELCDKVWGDLWH